MSVTKSRQCVALRPYESDVRKKVFALLDSFRLSIEVPDELKGATNEHVADYLRGKTFDVLLAPFHVVRIGETRTNGVELIDHVRESVPWTRTVPVIMPVSVFAHAAFSGAVKGRSFDKLIPLYEDELETEQARRKLSEYF